MNRIRLDSFGQIASADVKLGDLTVLVGPQATGKSIFLQLVKLLLDAVPIRSEFERFGIGWRKDPKDFLDLYFGEGMRALVRTNTRIRADSDDITIGDLLARRKTKGAADERLFYIPAQRLISLRDGITHPFTDFRAGDPFVVRDFSDRIHQLIQVDFSQRQELFPVTNRLKAEFRDLIDTHILAGYGLRLDSQSLQKRVILQSPSGGALPYLVWSAGQREFVPLLLGCYWLMPPSKISRREKLEYVVIEELEMGLHTAAISATLLLVLELLERGYKVLLSTHSPHVLDIVWALQTLKRHGGTANDVLELFELKKNGATRALCQSALEKTYSVAYFQRNGIVKDISSLDTGAADIAESGWGGLGEFTSRVSAVVAEAVARSGAWTAAK